MNPSRTWASLDPFYESGPMLGRIQANIQYIQTLLSLDPFDAYHFFPASPAVGAELAQRLLDEWPAHCSQGKIKVFDRRELPAALARQDYFAFHLSDCMVSPAYLACLRNAFSRQLFPITSLTHSLSYVRYGQDFFKHLHPGGTARDALIATSRSAVDVARAFYDGFFARYGLDRAACRPPRLEHIPLGVDLARFKPPSARQKMLARQEFGFGEETVFLVLARLSHNSKMDFLPILRAFHRQFLDGLPPRSVRLALAGWNDEADWGGGFLADLAANIGLKLTIVTRPDEERKLALYQACDVFVSPADNVQETFGLTLLEAQAAGLPTVASDFDGYRDLVLHETTGFLVPTTGPSRTDSIDLMAPLAFDTHTHLLLAQRLAVDVKLLARTVGLLATDEALRRRMGRDAAAHACAFSWERTVGSHVKLWETLWQTDPGPRPSPEAHPLALEYGRVFAGYPTCRLEDDTRLVCSRLGQAVHRGQDYPIIYEGLAEVIDAQAVRTLLVLCRKAAAVAPVCAKLLTLRPQFDMEQAQAHILWCLKHDLLERA